MNAADLHTHILPGMDDGAQTIDDALELLRTEAAQGVSVVALTPHFRTGKQEPSAFLHRRDQAFTFLSEAAHREPALDNMRLLAGAECFYTPMLAELDLKPFTIYGTNYLLLEMPVEHAPTNVRNILYHIQLQQLTPIIAHVERYPYLRDNPEQLYKWVDAGAICQINASSLLSHPADRSFIYACLKHQLAHILASDTHSIKKRPPQLRDAFEAVERKCGQALADTLRNNTLDIAGNQNVAPAYMEPLRHFGKWFF